MPQEHPLYEIKCTYEFLEDTFTEWGPNTVNTKELPCKYSMCAAAGTEKLKKDKRPSLKTKIGHKLRIPGYYKTQTEIKRNHPLKFMVSIPDGRTVFSVIFIT